MSSGRSAFIVALCALNIVSVPAIAMFFCKRSTAYIKARAPELAITCAISITFASSMILLQWSLLSSVDSENPVKFPCPIILLASYQYGAITGVVQPLRVKLITVKFNAHLRSDPKFNSVLHHSYILKFFGATAIGSCIIMTILMLTQARYRDDPGDCSCYFFQEWYVTLPILALVIRTSFINYHNLLRIDDAYNASQELRVSSFAVTALVVLSVLNALSSLTSWDRCAFDRDYVPVELLFVVYGCIWFAINIIAPLFGERSWSARARADSNTLFFVIPDRANGASSSSPHQNANCSVVVPVSMPSYVPSSPSFAPLSSSSSSPSSSSSSSGSSSSCSSPFLELLWKQKPTFRRLALILDTTELALLFQAHANRYLCGEYPLFYKSACALLCECDRVHFPDLSSPPSSSSSSSSSSLEQSFSALYTAYVQIGAPNELNIASHLRERTKQVVKDGSVACSLSSRVPIIRTVLLDLIVEAMALMMTNLLPSFQY